jgi:ATP-binding cassette subfamily B protein
VEELDRLADIAGIRNFVRELPLKWDTRIGEGGLALSGGQRQRLAIARALARHPELLILDEATTSFEEELERDILSRIRQEWPNLTIVIVTHRLSILSTVGQVYVLEQGRLMESGVPKDVILSLRERKMLVTAVGDS